MCLQKFPQAIPYDVVLTGGCVVLVRPVGRQDTAGEAIQSQSGLVVR
jgi:hypothetical protein